MLMVLPTPLPAAGYAPGICACGIGGGGEPTIGELELGIFDLGIGRTTPGPASGGGLEGK